jgi:lactaldehyde reductase
MSFFCNMSIFLKVLHLAFSVTFFLPFKFVNIITKAQKAFESKYSWKEFFIMANRIMLNQTSYHGAGAIQEIANEAKAHGFKKAFVCSDPDLVKFKVTAKVTDILTANGLDYELYSDIKANPTIQNVQHGVEAFKASGADYLIAIGGGSSMDTSKAIGIIIANPEFEDVRSLEGVAPTKKPCVPIIAVPTTAGTAAEVTINYVITDIERKRKFVCVDPHDMPIIAVVDPDMMSSMPKGLTASTGMDALTHAIEGYTTKAAWEMTDMFHLKAIEIISKSLRGAVANTKEGREGMALGQYIAGMGFSNVGLGIAHSMAHTLGAVYDTPHGVACAMMLPIVMEYNQECTGEKYREIARAMGVANVDSMSQDEYRKAAVDAVKKLSADVGIPSVLEAIKEEDLPFLAESAHADACAPGNPKDASVEDLKDLFRKIMA